MKAVFLPAAIAAIAASACATAPLTLDDDLVVPGERIGEVEIGMPLASLMALKGTPLTLPQIAETVPCCRPPGTPQRGGSSHSHNQHYGKCTHHNV